MMPKSVGGFRTTSCSTYLMLARIQISGRFDLKSSGASVAENCHIWKAHGKAIARGAITKNGKAALKLAIDGEISACHAAGRR
ncbi:hypothetical protein [Rhizobium hainanense]|uniref:hypothetical protein n=1 Tax=Rhizobium hainanense TaxID=52131 RepID=UPI00135661F6|nr:hypothetical protein [Rhizobium hainanense]